PQLGQDVLDVVGRCALGDHQHLSELAVGQAAREQRRHLLLTPGEATPAASPASPPDFGAAPETAASCPASAKAIASSSGIARPSVHAAANAASPSLAR